jgi:phosphatidylserine/phosphatidylglycerophosphate/cardiolipin synthase-like enzyme
MDSSQNLEHDKRILLNYIRLAQSTPWDKLHAATDFSEGYFNYLLYELFQTGEISKNEGNYQYVPPELRPKEQEINRLRETKHKEFRIKLEKYFDAYGSNISLEKNHFFLEGRHLDQFTKFTLDMAENEIIVVNPFVNECDLSKQLGEAKKRGLKVKLLARPPKDNEIDKIFCHEKLTKEGVKIIYDENVHAKIITIDDEVAITSSMNFYSESSAGKTWEAGIITLDRDIISEINKSILKQMN